VAFLPVVLTPREREIVGLALKGFDNGAIARRLGISGQVVRNRRRGIYDKLDITSERELFRLFLDHVMGDVPAG
jgi:DNA-binding CsgD family transcriptional regulator